MDLLFLRRHHMVPATATNTASAMPPAAFAALLRLPDCAGSVALSLSRMDTLTGTLRRAGGQHVAVQL